MTFKELGVSNNFIKGLKEMGISVPTKIQEEAIPILLHNQTDFIGKAQTGTGKTAAFGIPLLSRIDTQKKHTQALVLSPTRELGQQIAKQFFKFTKYTDRIFTESVYGGEKIEKQITDEADEMLSMGFKKDLTTILNKTKGHRNVWLFSATMPDSLGQIINTYVSKSAIRISVDQEEAVNKRIDHQFVMGDESGKLDTLTYFLKTQKGNRGIVFTKTKVAARTLSKQLKAKNYEVGLLEGEMTQKERDKVMRAFRKKTLQLLVSTDVAARGMDVANLAFVVHYQLPDQIEYYTHRSGRTARAGNTGVSLALIQKSELNAIKEIEKELRIRFSQIR